MEEDERNITPSIFDYAIDLAVKARVRALLVYADVFPTPEALAGLLARGLNVPIALASRHAGPLPGLDAYPTDVVQVPNVRLTRMGQIKVAILLGLSQGVFKPGDELVCVTGAAGTGLMDTITFTVVGYEFEMVSAAAGLRDLAEHVKPEVFERVLELAISLGTEGREGKPVGAMFVVGDTENVLAHSRQMVLNPFRGHPEEERNILDEHLTETVKEFAMIDGAFVVDGQGLLIAAGVYLHPPVAAERLPGGLGARHNSAAAITLATKALAVTVSASTGHVSVFWGGKMLVEIERPQVPMRPTPQGIPGEE